MHQDASHLAQRSKKGKVIGACCIILPMPFSFGLVKTTRLTAAQKNSIFGRGGLQCLLVLITHVCNWPQADDPIKSLHQPYLRVCDMISTVEGGRGREVDGTWATPHRRNAPKTFYFHGYPGHLRLKSVRSGTQELKFVVVSSEVKMMCWRMGVLR